MSVMAEDRGLAPKPKAQVPVPYPRRKLSASEASVDFFGYCFGVTGQQVG